MKNKKKLSIIAISLFSLSIVILGTYALWNQMSTTLANTIQTGEVKMIYSEVNELSLSNALPITDEAGKTLTDYFDFNITSYIKTNASDSTERKLKYNIVLEPLSVTNPLSDSEIKVYLTKIENGTETVVVEPTTISNLNQYIIKSQEEIFSNNKGKVTTSYRLRSWIDYNFDASKINEKSYSYKFRINVNNEDL
jgi:predicted ribosomally synthesized peptide with SipW-like signal peptide